MCLLLLLGGQERLLSGLNPHSVRLGLGELPHPHGRLISSALSLEGQTSWLVLPETRAGLSPQHCGHWGWAGSSLWGCPRHPWVLRAASQASPAFAEHPCCDNHGHPQTWCSSRMFNWMCAGIRRSSSPPGTGGRGACRTKPSGSMLPTRMIF